MTIAEKTFLRVRWSPYSARYRTEKRRKALENLRVDEYRNLRIEVLGNHARANVEVKRCGVWRKEKQVLIEDPAGKWCLYDPVADKGFVLHEYPKPANQE